MPICAQRVDFSTTLATRLIDVVSTMTLDEAIAAWASEGDGARRPRRRDAATPEDDTPADLAGTTKPLALPGGETLDVQRAGPVRSTIVNATRRFFARPSSVSLDAIGFFAPKPSLRRRLDSTPCATSHWVTEAARRRLKSSL